MPGTGFGGMLANLFNPGLDQQVAASITPNANPLAQQDQSKVPPVPGAPSNPAPGQAPPQVTQPDPTLAQTNQLLMRAYQTQNAADSFNQGLQRMAAGYGTAQQQASKQAALAGGGGQGGGQGYLDAIAKMQGIDAQQTAQTEHARAAANMSVLAKALNLPDTPDGVAQATEIWNSGMLPDFGRAAASNATLTGTTKDAEQATKAYADANPQATPQQISEYKANLIAGGMGGSDLGQRQYLAERSAALAAGQANFPDYLTWQGQHKAQADAMATQAQQVQTFKDTATQDYTSLNSKYTSMQPYIDTLVNDPASAQAALGSFQPTTGKWAAIDPFVSDKVKAAANALQKIQSTMSADALANTKNVRNQREFATLGQAASGGLNAAASPEDFQRTLNDLKNKYLDAQATNELAVGHKLTGNLIGHGNQDLLDSKNPYFNGGSQENDFRKMNDADAEAAYKQLAPGARYIGPDGVPRTK